jgi:hypothetical protein
LNVRCQAKSGHCLFGQSISAFELSGHQLAVFWPQVRLNRYNIYSRGS